MNILKFGSESREAIGAAYYNALGFDKLVERGILVEAARIALDEKSIPLQMQVIQKALENHLTLPYDHGFTRTSFNGTRNYLTNGEVRNFPSEMAFWRIVTKTESSDVAKFAVNSAIKNKDFAMLGEADFDCTDDWEDPKKHAKRKGSLIRKLVRDTFSNFDDASLKEVMKTPRNWTFDWLGEACDDATKQRICGILVANNDWARLSYMTMEECYPGRANWLELMKKTYAATTAENAQTCINKHLEQDKKAGFFMHYPNRDKEMMPFGLYGSEEAALVAVKHFAGKPAKHGNACVLNRKDELFSIMNSRQDSAGEAARNELMSRIQRDNKKTSGE
ncbi:Uncharacterised protein [uncultured archaeon]|nr:Uncharacterised protein [uncultured archaeon]